MMRRNPVKEIVQKIREILIPSVDKEIQDSIDRDSLSNLHLLSFAILVFELFTLFIFVVTREEFDEQTWVSIGSAGFCIATCLVIFFSTSRMRGRPQTTHKDVTAFKIFFAFVMSAWAIWISWRHYNNDDQLLTFFIVELIIVCFIPLKPWLSTVLTGLVYGGLYAVLYSVDRAATVNKFNYLMLVLVAMSGMIVRFHAQVRLSEKSLLLEKKNRELEYLSRHDGLTGLRNRMALNEDVAHVAGERVYAFMIDIDYFKELNDKYGHSAGDEVLRTAALKIKELYPESFHYRYGGDEFLIISTYDGLYEKDTFRFKVPAVGEEEILLSIGGTVGKVEGPEQLFGLISNADIALYEVKRRTHSPEFGGHERRRRK